MLQYSRAAFCKRLDYLLDPKSEGVQLFAHPTASLAVTMIALQPILCPEFSLRFASRPRYLLQPELCRAREPCNCSWVSSRLYK